MKGFIIGVVFLIVVGVAGYVYLSAKSQQAEANPAQVFKTESITRTGMLNASTVQGVDYKHTITDGGKVYGVASGIESLDSYVGKKVSATGQNSGTTLFIDTITIIE